MFGRNFLCSLGLIKIPAATYFFPYSHKTQNLIWITAPDCYTDKCSYFFVACLVEELHSKELFKKELPHFHFMVVVDSLLLGILLSCLINLQGAKATVCIIFKLLSVLDCSGSIHIKLETKQYSARCRH